MTHPATDRGVSLIELVAVMAVFSLVAVMALQLLSAGLRAQSRIAETSQHIPKIVAALAVLRRDLEGIQPVSGAGTGGLAGFVVAKDTPGLSIVTGGFGDNGWVDWRLRADGALTRGTRSLGQREHADDAVVMASGFSDLSLRVIDPGGTIRPAVSLRPDQAADLPRGFAIDFTHDSLGAIPLVVAR